MNPGESEATGDQSQVPASTCIVAESHRQAMDWSLVLSSQDIASTLIPPAEGDHWVLIIDAPDRDRALAALHQYQVENVGWGWRQRLPWTGILFHWGAIFWALALIGFYGFQAWKDLDLRPVGCVDSTLIRHGQWWRLFTAITLHADGGHLAANASTGMLLLGLAMARFGAGWGLLAAYAAGAFGNLAGILLDPEPHRSLGASGMVMGALGLVAIQSFAVRHASRFHTRLVISGILTGTMLFVLMGLDPKSDVLAHLGGFLGGLALGGILAMVPERVVRSPFGNGVALGLLMAAVLATWRWALAHPG